MPDATGLELLAQELRDMVQDDPKLGWRERYGAVGTEEIVPAEGQATAVHVLDEQDVTRA